MTVKKLILLMFLSACASHYYDDNPRNMKNMTADQIRHELGAK